MADEEIGLFEFLGHSTEARISHYRHRAADLRTKAETVPVSRRTELLGLAEHFEQLANRITMNRRA